MICITAELGHTGDVAACIHGIYAGLEKMNSDGLTADDLCEMHVRLDEAEEVGAWSHEGLAAKKDTTEES